LALHIIVRECSITRYDYFKSRASAQYVQHISLSLNAIQASGISGFIPDSISVDLAL
jgi:hypothetical protein